MKSSIFIVLFILNGFVKAHGQNPLTDSLIAWYPFDGDALDASGNGNDGTVYGATLTTDRFGNANSAYLFNGISDYIEYLATSNFKPTDFPVSITVWIKSNTPSGVGTFFKNDNAPNLYTGFIFQVQVDFGGVAEVHYGDGGTTGPNDRRSLFGTTVVNDNQWHFVGAVVRGPLDMDLYIDCNYESGWYDGSGGSLDYTNNNGTSGIYDVVSGTYYYEGKLDELRFYHRELTLTDLQNIYSYPNPFSNLSVNLGTDTSLCNGSNITLSPVTTGDIQSYLWSDGAQTSNINVSTSGTYWVTVFDGCSYATDSIEVGFGKSVAIYLPADTTICIGQALSIDAGNFYDTYLWSTGETTSSISVTDSGLYTVTVGLNGCTATDSITVSFIICNGIDQVSNESGISISYAMESHTLQILSSSINHLMDISIQLINSLGQKVLQSASISLANRTSIFSLPDDLPEGIYVVNVKVGNESVARSVIDYLK